jgi:hypothetical protein
MTGPGAPRYRFGPRDRRGLVAGARTGQVVVASASLVAGVGALRALGGLAGGLVGLAVALSGLALCFSPVRGMTIEQWVPVATRYLLDAALGRRRAVLHHGADATAARAPGLLGRLAVREVTGPGVTGAFGAVHDRAAGTWTAVLSLGAEAFALLDERDREQKVAAWSGVLSAVAGESGGLHRLQWVERTVPDRGEWLRADLEVRAATASGDPAVDAARASYASLLEGEGEGVLRHELFLACTVKAPASGAPQLAEEVARLDRRCRDAAVPVDGVLSRTGLASLLRRSFDVLPTASPATWPWPVAVETSWSAARTDGTWHATYWIAEWPRSDVGSDFLLPLLVGCSERRSVAIVMAAVPAQRAIRAAEHARTSTTADAELRRRHGFATSARRHREHEAVARRESELADGHTAYRFSGYVTVTVGDPGVLEASCARVEQAAALARVELRRLYGAQGEALAYTLPTGRGCA